MIGPVFLTDLEQVKTLLRLNEIPGGEVTEEILESALEEAATTLIEELGHVKLAQLQALSMPLGVPSNDDEFRALLAPKVELAIIKFILTLHLPMGFKDGRLEFVESYQSEGAFRDSRASELRALRDYLWADPRVGVERRLEFLRGERSAGDNDGARVALAGNSEGPDLLYYDTSEDEALYLEWVASL